MTPSISVVIATRNRPDKLNRLLATVRNQDLEDIECLVIDDASTDDTAKRYAEIWSNFDSRFKLHRLPENVGPATARNTGIQLARSPYVAFCDDDDFWTRDDHLSVASKALLDSGADFYFADMQTSTNGGKVANPSWYSALKKSSGIQTGSGAIRSISKTEMASFLKSRILHANTLVIKRAVFGGRKFYWEKLRFAEDQDMGLRLVDRAQHIKFRSTVCADLDVSDHASIAHTFATEDRILFGILAAIHAEWEMASPLLRSVARANRSWRLLELAKLRERSCNMRAARELAFQSILLHLSAQGLKDYLHYFVNSLLSNGGRSDRP